MITAHDRHPAADITVAAGQTATFWFAATGTDSLSYQWQSRITPTDAFADIPGATASTYTTPATS